MIGQRAQRHLSDLYRRADQSHITGLSSMIAYGLLWSIFPGVLLLLFLAGQVLSSPDILSTLQREVKNLFPSVAETSVADAIQNLKARSTSLGLFAIIAALWGSMLFFGALESGFSRIYRIPGRSWTRQRLLALKMLVLPLTIILLETGLSVIEGILLGHVDNPPFGLSSRDVSNTIEAGIVAGHVVILFGFMVTIYWIVPNRAMAWSGVWPGALLTSVAVALLSILFPLYLTRLSNIGAIGTTFSFVIIVLLWFYLISLFLTFGACVNALRIESLERRAEPEERTADDDGPAALDRSAQEESPEESPEEPRGDERRPTDGPPARDKSPQGPQGPQPQ